MPMIFVVPPPLASPEMIVESSRSSPISGPLRFLLLNIPSRLLMILLGLLSQDLVSRQPRSLVHMYQMYEIL